MADSCFDSLSKKRRPLLCWSGSLGGEVLENYFGLPRQLLVVVIERFIIGTFKDARLDGFHYADLFGGVNGRSQRPKPLRLGLLTTHSSQLYASNGLSHSGTGSFMVTRWPFSKTAT